MAGFLSDAELSDMRTDGTSALPSLCYVQRLTNTSDGAGGTTKAYANTTINQIACHVSTVAGGSGPESERTGRIEQEVNWTVLLPYGTDVKATDRIAIEALILEVKAVATPSDEILRVVAAVEVA